MATNNEALCRVRKYGSTLVALFFHTCWSPFLGSREGFIARETKEGIVGTGRRMGRKPGGEWIFQQQWVISNSTSRCNLMVRRKRNFFFSRRVALREEVSNQQLVRPPLLERITISRGFKGEEREKERDLPACRVEISGATMKKKYIRGHCATQKSCFFSFEAGHLFRH